MRTRSLVTALSLVTLSLLAGCGSEDDGPAASGATLSVAALTSALIDAEDLGVDFVVDDDDDDDDDDPKLGCLDAVSDQMDKKDYEPAVDRDVSFKTASELEMPFVFNTIGSFEKEADAVAMIKAFRTLSEDCSQVDETDKDGFRVELEVSVDSEKAAAAADEQVNLNARGTAGGGGISLPMSFRLSAIRVGNDVTVVGYMDLDKDISAAADAVDVLALTKLVPVTQGKPAPEVESLDLEASDPTSMLGGAA